MKKRVLNPYLPSYEYVPDGEPHVFGDRLYLFGSHDRFNGKIYCENDYVCWSAPVDDLSDWRYEGVIYRRAQDPVAAKEESQFFAPDVARGADGRYYLYYGLDFKNRVGIAVCDTPAGSYEYYGSVCYPDGMVYGGKPGETFRFDPAVLVDDDGSVYLYTGFCNPDEACQRFWLSLRNFTIDTLGSVVVKLDKDMKTVISEPKQLLPGVGSSKGTGFEGHEFYEASSIRKFDGRYYAVYSSILSHELAYAVSDYPDREFKFQGALYSNGNIGFQGQQLPTAYWGNNHGSIECVCGEYYIFGHRQTNGTECSRQGIAEKLKRNPDGSFEMAEMTSGGIGGVLPAVGEYEAAIACVLMGKDGAVKSTLGPDKREEHPYFGQDGQDREEHPTQYIANFSDGCIAGYQYFALTDPVTPITLVFRPHARETGKGVLTLATDRMLQSVIAKSDAEIQEGIHAMTLDAHIRPGIHAIYIHYQGTGSMDLLRIRFHDDRSPENRA